jgi:hypothetical protein
MSFYQSAQPIVIPDPTVVNPSVQTVTAGSNVTITGTASNPVVNAAGVVTSITAGSNITVTGTSAVPIINATIPPQGVVTLNGTLTTTGSNVEQVGNGLAGDCFGINTNAFNITGDAYMMTVTAQITSATFAPNTPNAAPDGYIKLACSVGSVVGSYPFIYFPFPKITGNITGSNAADYFITASGVFVSDPVEGVSIGIDNQTGCALGAGQFNISLTNISFVGLGNNILTQTDWK